MARIGLLGGAFNPPHAGHLRLAELAWNQLALDEVRFVPTALSPHKPLPPGTPPPATRLHLVEALLRHTSFPARLESLEIQRGGTSYTVDTLEALAAREPGTAWILLVGCDQANTLLEWRRLDRILELAAIAIAPRPGVAPALPTPLVPRIHPVWSGAPGELVWLPSTGLEISSLGLRADLGARRPSPGLPAGVEAAIMQENLYRGSIQEAE